MGMSEAPGDYVLIEIEDDCQRESGVRDDGHIGEIAVSAMAL
jgi:hypothetical protein